MSNNNDDGGGWNVIFTIYLVISQVMTLYYWYDYAQHNGFAATVFIGPFVAEFKGLFWIITIFV